MERHREWTKKWELKFGQATKHGFTQGEQDKWEKDWKELMKLMECNKRWGLFVVWKQFNHFSEGRRMDLK